MNQIYINFQQKILLHLNKTLVPQLTIFKNNGFLLNIFLIKQLIMISLLNKSDEEFRRLSESRKQYENNYQFNRNCFSRRVFQRHTIDTLFDVRVRVKQIQQVSQNEGNSQPLNINNVPNLKLEDTSVQLGKNLLRSVRKNMRKQKTQDITTSTLYKSLFDFDLVRIIFIIVFELIQVFCRLGIIILFKQLLDTVTQPQGQNISNAYLFASMIGILWLLGVVMRQNATFQIRILIQRAKGSLMMLIFKQVSNVSFYAAKDQEVGKIINRLSHDFNLIQLKASYLFRSFTTPLMIIGCMIILIINLGWPGIISLIFIIVLIPLLFLLGRKNGSLSEQANIFRQKRIKLSAQILQNIKSVKIYGWIAVLKGLIQSERQQEGSRYIKLCVGRTLEMVLANSTILWSVLICLLIVQSSDQQNLLTGANIITALVLGMNLRNYFFLMSVAIGFYYEFQAIMGRVCENLSFQDESMIVNKEQRRKVIDFISTQSIMAKVHYGSYETLGESQKYVCEKGDIKFTAFDGFWSRKRLKDPILTNIHLHIKQGEFYGIIGQVGSGKSSIFSALINEIPYYAGTVQKKGSILLIQQDPVIFSVSIKENILFGLEYEKQKYSKCLEDSCLRGDLQFFENEDETIVGEKGITLTRGQKVKLAIARGLYSSEDADIYLFDDPMMAVDSKEAKQIYQNVILRFVGKKTIILATQQVSYLEYCDRVIVLEDGKIVHNNTYKDLRRQLSEFEVLEHHQDLIDYSDEQSSKVSSVNRSKFKRFVNPTQITEQVLRNQKKQQNIRVSWRSYVEYFLSTKRNKILFALAIAFFVVTEGFTIGLYRLIAGYDDLLAGRHDLFTETEDYWGIISMFVVFIFIFSLLKYFFMNLVIVFANKDLHDKMIESILKSECSFFETISISQLKSKFSNDLGTMDSSLAFTFIIAVQGTIAIVIMLINMFTIDYFFMIPAIICTILIIVLYFFSKNTIIKCKQLQMKTKVAVFEMYSQVLSGLVPIKVFQKRHHFLKKFSKLVNHMLRGSLSYWLTITAYSTYISYTVALLFLIESLLGLSNIQRTQTQSQKASIVGLYGISIIFLIYISDKIDLSFRQIIKVQTMMTSFERSNSIARLKPQKQIIVDYDTEAGIKEKSNPKKAPSLKLQNFSYRYLPDLPLVLKNISLNIKPKERVGIVGRPEAGKSSIIQALFRTSEPEQGSIYQFQDADALKMNLSDLRHMISVIPQHPFLFSGTIRKNIDPQDKYSNQSIWIALQEGVRKKIQRMPEQLETEIDKLQEGFSKGEKQLIYLARAVLRKKKFIILDEPISKVDMRTYDVIQKWIALRLRKTTLITIAHRLNSVADYDTIIVMSRGRIVENGTPYQLIKNGERFSEMVNNTGKNARIITKIAEENYSKKLNK